MSASVENSSPTSPTNKKKRPIVLIVLLLLLIPAALLGGLYLGSFWQKKEHKEEIVENTSLEEVQNQSDSLYRALQQELEFYKTQSDSLYPEIAEREEELDKQYIRLQNLIKQAKQDKSSEKEIKAKLVELRSELKRLRTFVDDQTLDLAEMRRANAQLIAEKEVLQEKYEEELNENEKLTQENNTLSKNNEELNEKVDMASILQVANVHAIGAKLSRKGSDKESTKAKKTEFIKVCFDVVRNEVTRPGINKFYMRITDPTGWPIFVESRGSGKLHNKETGKEEFYTTLKSFNYNPDFKSICMTWSQIPSKPFQKGHYQIEIFNKGYKIASTSMELK
jgi:hypothetical protein